MPFTFINEITFPKLIRDTVAKGPDHMALETSSVHYTYAELERRTRHLAAGFYRIGIRRGTHVCLWAELWADTVITYLALMRLGATSVMMRTTTPEDMVGGILKASDCTFAICGKEQLPMFRKGQPQSDVQALITMEDCAGADHSFAELEKLGETMSEADFRILEDGVSPSDTSEILFTSGTTGNAKMVMVSQYTRLNMGRLVAHNLRATPDDKFLTVLPFFHVFSLDANITTALSAGACIRISDSRHTSDIVKAIRCGCTVLNTVPTQLTLLVKREDLTPEDCRKLRIGMVAGAGCTPTLFRAAEEKLGMMLFPSLGMTECAGGLTAGSVEDDLETRSTTVGHIQQGVEGKIIDVATGKPLPDGEKGELCVRGFCLMKGYYKAPELTAAAIDSEGWLHTGDLAWRDEQGRIRLAGRIKELIIRCGENIYPGEIENLIAEMPQVSAVKVAATPDEIFGEEVCAVIVKNPGASLSNRDIVAHLHGRIESNRIPRYYLYVEAIPLNPVGKPDLTAIQRIAAGAAGMPKESVPQ